MPSHLDVLARALADQRAGRLAAAEVGYRAVLAAAPAVPMAARLLGLLLRQSGRTEEALAVLRTGAAARPDDAALVRALADALLATGDAAAAVVAYRVARATDPHDPAVLVNLANALRATGQHEDAAAACHEALALAPASMAARVTLAAALLGAGDVAGAIAAYREATQRHPGEAVAWAGLGMALLHGGEPARALAAADSALRHDDRLAEAWFVRGTALNAMGRIEEAIACLERAVVLDPTHARAHLNLGNAYLDRDDLPLAEAGLRAAIALDPTLAEAHASLGFLLSGSGRLEEATAACETAIALRPEFAQAHWNLSFARLLAGDFERGWREYEWRKRHDRFAGDFRSLPGPEWQGEDLAGRRLLVHAEQGFGDTIQFARYLPVLARAGAHVTLACARPLIPLLSGLPGLAAAVPRDAALPARDAWVDQMSLPRLLGTRPDTIPAMDGYLAADPALAAAWAGRLPAGPRVGIVWRGNPAHSNDARRSMPLTALAPVLRVADVGFVSLQVGPRSREIEAAHGIADRSAGLTDFARTAALIANLDLVIAVDTATAHLAAAMGRPTWILLPFAPDWRWMTGRDDSPWYASVRLFRQTVPGGWDGVATRVVAALRAWAAASRR